MLSDAFAEFGEFPFGFIDYPLVARRLAAVLSADAAIVSSVDSESGMARTEAIYTEARLLAIARDQLGFEPVGRLWKIDEPLRATWTGKVVKLDGLYDVLLRQVPRVLCQQLDRILGVNAVYAIGLTHRGQVLGNALALYGTGHDLDHPVVFELFGRLFGSLLLRKRAEVQLEQERQRLAITLRGVHDATLSVDRAGRVVLLNPAAERLFGVRDAIARGMPLEELATMSGSASVSGLKQLAATLEAGKASEQARHHCALRTCDGRNLDLMVHAEPVCGNDGEVIGTVLVLHEQPGSAG